MTQAAPVQWGQQAVSDRIPHAEQVIDLGGYTNVIAYPNSLTFGLGTVTMPFDGQLTANINHQGNYPNGLVAVSLWLDGCTPAPANHYAGAFTNYQDVGTAYDVLGAMAQWRDLAKGTGVTINAKVRVDLGNVNWTCMAFTGWLRMARI